MTEGVSSATTQAVYSAQLAKAARDNDGDNDQSKVSGGTNIGPAVVLSLGHTTQGKAPDAAAGDPDHDGQ